MRLGPRFLSTISGRIGDLRACGNLQKGQKDLRDMSDGISGLTKVRGDVGEVAPFPEQPASPTAPTTLWVGARGAVPLAGQGRGH